MVLKVEVDEPSDDLHRMKFPKLCSSRNWLAIRRSVTNYIKKTNTGRLIDNNRRKNRFLPVGLAGNYDIARNGSAVL